MKEKEEQRLINLKQYECELRSKGYKYICIVSTGASVELTRQEEDH